MKLCDVSEATHVKVGGRLKKIASTWGISESGRVASPKAGGFGVITEDGEEVSMYEARAYFREE